MDTWALRVRRSFQLYYCSGRRDASDWISVGARKVKEKEVVSVHPRVSSRRAVASCQELREYFCHRQGESMHWPIFCGWRLQKGWWAACDTISAGSRGWIAALATGESKCVDKCTGMCSPGFIGRPVTIAQWQVTALCLLFNSDNKRAFLLER